LTLTLTLTLIEGLDALHKIQNQDAAAAAGLQAESDEAARREEDRRKRMADAQEKTKQIIADRAAEAARIKEEAAAAVAEAKARHDAKWDKLRGAAEENEPDPPRDEGEEERAYLKRVRKFQDQKNTRRINLIRAEEKSLEKRMNDLNLIRKNARDAEVEAKQAYAIAVSTEKKAVNPHNCLFLCGDSYRM